MGWGCIDNKRPTMVLSCGTPQGDWVYYGYPSHCNVPISYTLCAGNTAILVEGCTALYPARVLSMLTNSSSPVLFVNHGAELSSYLITAEATLMGNIARGPVRSSARAESGCTGMVLCKTKL